MKLVKVPPDPQVLKGVLLNSATASSFGVVLFVEQMRVRRRYLFASFCVVCRLCRHMNTDLLSWNTF